MFISLEMGTSSVIQITLETHYVGQSGLEISPSALAFPVL